MSKNAAVEFFAIAYTSYNSERTPHATCIIAKYLGLTSVEATILRRASCIALPKQTKRSSSTSVSSRLHATARALRNPSPDHDMGRSVNPGTDHSQGCPGNLAARSRPAPLRGPLPALLRAAACCGVLQRPTGPAQSPHPQVSLPRAPRSTQHGSRISWFNRSRPSSEPTVPVRAAPPSAQLPRRQQIVQTVPDLAALIPIAIAS